jgi:hypothetical protein
MAKAKQQPSDTVVKSKTPSQMTVEKLQNNCYELLIAMKSDGDEAKEYSTRKRENKEKLIPLLRALKTKLSRQGKKDGVDGWTAWFNENKEDFGISLRTADRWIDPPTEKKKYANIDNADGLTINGKKFDYKFKFRHSRIIGLILTPAVESAPVVVPEKSTAIVETQPVEKSEEEKKAQLVRIEEARKKRIERAAEVRALQVAAGQPKVTVVIKDDNCPTETEK